MKKMSGKKTWFCALMVIVLSGLVSSVRADLNVDVGESMYFSNWRSGQLAGTLTANPVVAGSFKAFTTFCVEPTEYVDVNGGAANAYLVDGIGLVAKNSYKTMSEMTAWLYTEFLNNQLSNFNGSVTDCNALQYAIWMSMGYTDQNLNQDGISYQSAKNTYMTKNWNQEFQNSQWTGYGNIRIANLISVRNGSAAQDMLVSVPAPAALLLGGIGLGLVKWTRRRFA